MNPSSPPFECLDSFPEQFVQSVSQHFPPTLRGVYPPLPYSLPSLQPSPRSCQRGFPQEHPLHPKKGLHEITTANPSPSTPSPPGNTTTSTRRIIFKSSYWCKNLITFYQNVASFHFEMEQGFLFSFNFMTASTKADAAFLTSSIDSIWLLFVINSTGGDTRFYSSPFLLNGLTIYPDKIPFLQLTGQPSPTPRPPLRSRAADSRPAFNAHN